MLRAWPQGRWPCGVIHAALDRVGPQLPGSFGRASAAVSICPGLQSRADRFPRCPESAPLASPPWTSVCPTQVAPAANPSSAAPTRPWIARALSIAVDPPPTRQLRTVPWAASSQPSTCEPRFMPQRSRAGRGHAGCACHNTRLSRPITLASAADSSAAAVPAVGRRLDGMAQVSGCEHQSST